MARMRQAADTAGVIAPPPLLLAGVIVFGLLLDWLLPAYVLEALLSLTERIIIALILIASGAAITFPALRGFRAVGTRVEPWKPSTRLVTDGIFAWLRNPMYVGGTLFLIGLSILLASDWILVLTLLFAVVMHYGVVLREERYLEAKFGDDYRRYKASVPRYGIPG